MELHTAVIPAAHRKNRRDFCVSACNEELHLGRECQAPSSRPQLKLGQYGDTDVEPPDILLRSWAALYWGPAVLVAIKLSLDTKVTVGLL